MNLNLLPHSIQHKKITSRFLRIKSWIGATGVIVFLILIQGNAFGQTTNLFLRNATTQSGTGGYVYDLSLTQGTGNTVTSAGNASTSLTEVLAFTINISTLSSAISGNSFPVSVLVNAVQSTNMNGQFRLQRVNSSGVVQASTGYSGNINNTGTYTATLSFTPAQTWAPTDRLRLSIEIARSASGGTARTITISTGSANSYIQYTACTPPSQPSTINGNSTICNGSTQTYSVTNVAGVTYSWTLPTGWSGSSTTNSITVTAGSSPGTISVTPSNACGNGTSRSLAVTISAPVATISSQTNITCFGANDGTITVSASGGTSTYTFSIETPANWLPATGTDLRLFTGLAPETPYRIRVKDNNGCISR